MPSPMDNSSWRGGVGVGRKSVSKLWEHAPSAVSAALHPYSNMGKGTDIPMTYYAAYQHFSLFCSLMFRMFCTVISLQVIVAGFDLAGSVLHTFSIL